MGFGLDVAVRQGADAAGQGCWFGPGSDLDQQESVTVNGRFEAN